MRSWHTDCATREAEVRRRGPKRQEARRSDTHLLDGGEANLFALLVFGNRPPHNLGHDGSALVFAHFSRACLKTTPPAGANFSDAPNYGTKDSPDLKT